jgi:hypothetical protein
MTSSRYTVMDALDDATDEARGGITLIEDRAHQIVVPRQRISELLRSRPDTQLEPESLSVGVPPILVDRSRRDLASKR